MLRKEVQLCQKEILVMNSDFRQGLFTRAMMLTAKQEQSKDLSQWQKSGREFRPASGQQPVNQRNAPSRLEHQ